jgi:hypothetical protein
VEEEKCRCYSEYLNPYERCALSSFAETQGRRRRQLTTSNQYVSRIAKTSVKCICPFDAVNGYFKDVSKISHQFGKPNPPICDQCIVESLGPKPLENPSGSFTKACTIFGNYDPNYANITFAWRPCSDHGYWNGTMCLCNRGWQLGDELPTFNSSIIIKSCDVCDFNYGPAVQPNAIGAPYCTKVYTPDENGIPRECGGKGVFLYGACQCYHGYSLITFENVKTCL